MAKYTSDTNLIRGAATVGQSMMPTDLSGLDKVTQAGMGVMDEAVKGYEAEQKKLEQEAREAQAKADKLNNDWNTLASGVYENAGSFMKDVEYKDTVASVKALRQEYIDAQNSKDAEKMAEVKIKFNNINAEVAAHKEFRALLTHPEYGMSDFVKGDKLEYMNKFIDEDYVIGRNDKGEKTYTIDGVSKTMEEINKMVGVKNMKLYGDYGKLLNDYSTSKTKGNRNNLLLSIRNSIVPDQENPLRAFLNDKGFGNGQTFSDLLKTDVNRASIEKEIMGGAFDNEEDSKGVITEDEYNNFINAIVNPDNKFWKNNGGASAWKNQSRTIATELLANGAENAWDDEQDNKTPKIIQLTPSERLANAKFLADQQEKQQTQTDVQNTVYSIENEFSAGETTIGTGSRYVQKSEETTVENDDGTTTTIPASWTFFVNGKVEKTIKTNDPDVLDEITKHITDTAGKYGTFKIGVSEKEITKDGVTTTYVYAGYGKWSLKK